jgi:hypothetical protein
LLSLFGVILYRSSTDWLIRRAAFFVHGGKRTEQFLWTPVRRLLVFVTKNKPREAVGGDMKKDVSGTPSSRIIAIREDPDAAVRTG